MAGWIKKEGTDAVALKLAAQHLFSELSPHIELAKAAKEIPQAIPTQQQKPKQTA
jgi:hypothetical protein